MNAVHVREWFINKVKPRIIGIFSGLGRFRWPFRSGFHWLRLLFRGDVIGRFDLILFQCVSFRSMEKWTVVRRDRSSEVTVN